VKDAPWLFRIRQAAMVVIRRLRFMVVVPFAVG